MTRPSYQAFTAIGPHKNDYVMKQHLLSESSSASSSQNITVRRHNDQFHTENSDKANILKTFFQSQTFLDDSNKAFPECHLPEDQPCLGHFVITESEVSSLKSLSKVS
ncbi:hypothetical protein MAR_005477, partial [Mya arenaria]